MATYEQYGEGRWVVRATWNDGRGVYRFASEQEAKEWRALMIGRYGWRVSQPRESGRSNHHPITDALRG